MNTEKQRTTDEVTLKDLILKIRELFFVCLKNWIWLLLFSALFVGYFLYNHYNFEKTYSTQSKFIIEGQSGGGNPLSGLLGQIGMNRGSGNNPFKVLIVSRSNKMTEKLFEYKIENELVPNYIIQSQGLDEKWKEQSSDLQGFRFTDIQKDIQTAKGKRVFVQLKSMLWGSESNRKNALLKLKYNEDTGVFILNSKTKTEALSVGLLNKLFSGVKDFFELEIFENQQATISILENKLDSLKGLRDKKIYQLAAFRDGNRNLTNSSSGVKKAMLETEIQSLFIAYTDLLKTKEIADFNLRDIKPLFIAIDEPMTPLKASSSSLLKSIVKGIILGLFVGSLIILIVVSIRNAIRN